MLLYFATQYVIIPFMRIRHILFTVIIVLVICTLATAGAILQLFRKYAKELPSTTALEEYKPGLITRFYDIHNEVIAEMFTERRTVVPLQKIPVDLQNAVIATEDERFFKHWGLDLRGIGRATVNNIFKGRVVEGGSTITQQLARALFLTQDRTYQRKIKEALLSLQIEKKYTKEEILQMYLNQVYFGHGAYGVEQASRIYFGKHVQDLNIAECALVAGMLRAPKAYSPFEHPASAQRRAQTVLSLMYHQNYITLEERNKALQYKYYTQKPKYVLNAAPYFIELAKQDLEDKYGIDAIYKGGLQIYTTLDLGMQQSADQALDRKLSAYAIKASTDAPVQCGLIAIDPKNGQIRVLVGGRSFEKSQFNRVTQAKRQPGSAFKTFIFTAALENGMTASTLIDDSPVTLMGGDNKEWAPQNYDKEFWGPTTLRRALENSRNLCAVKLIVQITPEVAVNYAHQLGIQSPLGNNLSLSLGTSEVNLAEITSAFCTFANYGIKTTPYSIIRVKDTNGNVLEQNTPVEQPVLSEQTAYLMTNLLKGVVQHGTGYAAKALGRPCAGKTGTSNDYRDAWFIGYTPDLACGVWVGYDDHRIISGKQTGGAIACPIWTDFMEQSLQNFPTSDFKIPSKIKQVKIDYKSGLLAPPNWPNPFVESYLAGTEPIGYATTEVKKEIKPAVVTGESGY
ncbi:MAG: penicillin-binding protein 1A [Elusimicrobia bacterium]|nr:penicillin-binding protein 1A [Elusimicrobiota bacterium]